MTLGHKKKITAAFALMLLGACSDIPKEVPELSYAVGQDIAAMQASHQTLVRTLFKELKQRRLDYVDNVWAPRFVKNFIANGKLLEIAQGAVYWDDAKQDFVSQTGTPNETKLLSSVVFWGQAAVDQIAAKKAELITPLDEKETQLLAEIDTGYAQILAANAQVTAFITTLRGVQELDDQALKAVGLGGLRTKIVNDMANISNWANDSLQTVKKADAKVAQVGSIVTQAKKLVGEQ